MITFSSNNSQQNISLNNAFIKSDTLLYIIFSLFSSLYHANEGNFVSSLWCIIRRCPF